MVKGSIFAAAAIAALGVSAARADVNGTLDGVFINPAPPSATVTGVGTSTFTWGEGDPSSMTFVPATPFASPLETEFKLGTLQYSNGEIDSGTGATSVDLKVTLHFISPAVGDQSFAFTMDMINTPNTFNPTDSADYVIFPSNFPSTIFVIDSTQYTLEITGFENVVGDGFLTSDDAGFHVKENKSGSADLYAKVTSDVSGVQLPEPASLGILGVGVSGLLFRRRKTA